MKRLLPLAVLASLSYMAPSHAALFDDDEARRAIINLRTELTPRIERLEESSRGQLELSNQNELLRTEVSKLQGQLEVLLHEIDSLKQRQRDFYVDLDSRVRKLETGPAAAAPEAQAPVADPAAESRDYEAALNLLKDGKYKDAQTAFDQFIKRYPRSAVQPGAHFWAGNAALQSKEVAVASNYFKTVLANWPNDPVAPDAMLGIANSQQALGDVKASHDTLKKLVERFPESSAGKAAKQRLARKP
ncbi:tol-pal system protein YbgF [Azoarcus sp. DN11]|uniref:tol-pal system protein YbgF n=1 Tax=Azoarcus sp. DN11 TaxID=356837 RepID=UPI000EB2CEE6|nr:tol-pal system protein YbgF [Azoarcus sp. DN11]AYH45771.1 tol-pal system protein YbgF [Azoarcus sp. DN11]